MTIGPEAGGLWTMTSDGKEQRRLTMAPGIGVWASADRWVGNADTNPSWEELFTDSIDGSSPRAVLTSLENSEVFPTSVNADGLVAYSVYDPDGNRDAWVVDSASGGKPQPFLVGPYNEGGVKVSPDGRHVAYVSDKTL